jgi:hypothetical protein
MMTSRERWITSLRLHKRASIECSLHPTETLSRTNGTTRVIIDGILGADISGRWIGRSFAGTQMIYGNPPTQRPAAPGEERSRPIHEAK